MYSFSHRSFVALISFYLISTNPVWAQASRKLGLNLGFAAWTNNCDIPAGGQHTENNVSLGPALSMHYGKIHIRGTFFIGNFHVDPKDGLLRRSSPDTVVFADPEAARRGFTSAGKTERIDLNLHIGYNFNQYALLSLGLMVNRHHGDLEAYFFPTLDAQKRIAELPSQRRSHLKYTDTQFWLGENLSGAVSLTPNSNRMAIFYDASLMVFAGESGEGSARWKGKNHDVGPRPHYSIAPGQAVVIPQKLPLRPFGENVGIAFSAGINYELSTKPLISIMGGYNIKFFAEDETELIDHSVFKGLWAGISFKVY
jgi:hypothetical protein